jgi:hypothetical protein
MAREDHAELFASARTALVNGRDIPEVQALLAPMGYDTGRMEDGISLLGAAELSDSRQAIEYGEKEAATGALAEAFGAFRAACLRHVTLARVAFEPGTAGYVTLGLAGSRADGVPELLAQARQFYRGVVDNAAFATALAPFALTPAAAGDALDVADAVEAARAAQAREFGEAQVATRVRDDAVGALRGFLSDYYAVAKVALADHPQLRETLGLLERGSH